MISEKPQKVYKEITEVATDIFQIEKVIDWNKRIQNYPSTTKNLYNKAFAKVQELL
jgi:hypothetical protein